MPYLELQKLHKEFGDFTAIEEIDVALEPGEFLSLLGPSGCGKTTALRIVAGFETPTSGRVVIEGNDVTNIPANKRDMGMVFQAYSLFPNMTAEANVEFGLRIRGESGVVRRKRVEELLELVGLTAAAKRYPHQLSGGMQQRVALARALAIEPRVLLLDEPLSALDAKVRVQLREEIRRLQTQLGITTLYVTHDQEEALSISDRVAVLSHGRIEQIGSPAEIYNAPGTPFVAEFIGTMNRLEATVADSWAGTGGRKRPRGQPMRTTCPSGSASSFSSVPRLSSSSARTAGWPGAIIGEVVAHIFLGAITRVKVDAGDHELSADLPGHKAAELPDRLDAWQRASRRTEGASSRSASQRPPSKCRPVSKDPGHAERGELQHPRGLVDGEDRGLELRGLSLLDPAGRRGLLEADPPVPGGRGGVVRVQHAADLGPALRHAPDRAGLGTRRPGARPGSTAWRSSASSTASVVSSSFTSTQRPTRPVRAASTSSRVGTSSGGPGSWQMTSWPFRARTSNST